MQKGIVITGFLIVAIAGFFQIQSRYPVFREKASSPVHQEEQYYKKGDIAITTMPHQKRGGIETRPFSRYEGDVFGLDKHVDFSALDFVGPFGNSSAIASGDFNNDLWQDIVLGARKGILLYKNLGTSRFALQEVDIPEISNLNVILVAFADIDNDGWQDMYLASYGGKNYFIINDRKGFQNPRVIPALNEGTKAPRAVSFGDLDKDGYLDFVNGNGYSFLSRKKVPPLSAVNTIITNRGLQFKEDNLQEVVGQTLSVLLSDFTNDHILDLMIGNDSFEPDVFYTGNTAGNFKKVLASDTIIPISALSTMSIDTADFNNDLYMDIYVGGISLSPFSLADEERGYCFEIKNSKEKQKCESNLKILKIIAERDIEKCFELKNPGDRNDCAVMVILNLASDQDDESLCGRIPEEYETHVSLCRDYFSAAYEEVEDSREDIVQGTGNVLLQGSKQGIFTQVPKEFGVDEGRWAWNAKFADLDNDEWQDIYVANGRWQKQSPYSNVFFHNHEGRFFETAQKEFNVEDFNMVTAFLYIDIDNDGDLDIVSGGLNGPINVYINNENKNNSITFEFRDKKGNHFGVGNKVYIYYGENNERHQMREIKLGGGFISFDPAIAHFGLGTYDTVQRVEIVWSTGEKTIMDRDFLANKKYVITRN